MTHDRDLFESIEAALNKEGFTPQRYVAHRWPTKEELEKMDTYQLSALANALGVGRWIMDESRGVIVEYLWGKIAEKRIMEARA